MAIKDKYPIHTPWMWAATAPLDDLKRMDKAHLLKAILDLRFRSWQDASMHVRTQVDKKRLEVQVARYKLRDAKDAVHEADAQLRELHRRHKIVTTEAMSLIVSVDAPFGIGDKRNDADDLSNVEGS